MNLSLRKTLTLFFCLPVLLCSGAPQASAELFKPVDAMYMVRDPSAPNGYVEKMKWLIRSPSDWARFYDNLPNLPRDTTNNSDPLNGKVEDMIVFTHTDENGLTGYDIYVSNLGIMAVTRGSTSQLFPDSNQLRSYLNEEQKQRASFEDVTDTVKKPVGNGIAITYNINESIPNPVWYVNSPDEMRLYDSFFKGLKPLTGEPLKYARRTENFDGFGNFVMQLNYPRAPARIATVGRSSIRFSNGFISTNFYQDSAEFYKFFKDQAREMMKYKEQNKINEQEAIDKRKF